MKPAERPQSDEHAPESHAREARRPPTRGALAGITPEGVVLATWGGAEARHVEVALALSHRAILRAIVDRASVLVDFLDGDEKQPVVVALLRSRLEADAPDPTEAPEGNVEIVAGQTLTLRCGQSSLELSRDGRVVLRGAELRSMATGGNILQGAHVDIN